MRTVNTVDYKKLSSSQKERLLKSLYEKYQLEITLEREAVKSNPDIQLTDFAGVPDCCISNFHHNYYFRTKKGMKAEKYSTLGGLIREIKKLIKTFNYNICSNIRIYYHKQHIFSLEI